MVLAFWNLLVSTPRQGQDVSIRHDWVPAPELGNYAMLDRATAGLSGGIRLRGPRWSRADDVLRRRAGSSGGARSGDATWRQGCVAADDYSGDVNFAGAVQRSDGNLLGLVKGMR
jgi:hypothetical protein